MNSNVRALVLLGPVTWLAGVAPVAAQPRDADEDLGCPSEVRAELPELDGAGEHVACARIGETAVGVRIEVVPATEDEATGDDVTMRLVTSEGDLTFSLGDRRAAYGYGRLGWWDSASVSIAPLEGAPGFARVSVVLHMGEDYYGAEETLVVVSVRRRPRVRWVGPGRLASSAMGVCHTERATTLSVHGGTLRVRSTVAHTLVPFEEAGVPQDLHSELARECRSPPRVWADVLLRGP